MACARAPDRRGRTGRRERRFLLTAGLALLLGAPEAAAAAELEECPTDPRILEALQSSGVVNPGRMLALVPVSPQLFPVVDREYNSPDWIVLPGCSISLSRAGDGILGGPHAAARLRALAGVAGILGLEVANYWIERDVNAPDWEMSWSWPSWEKKMIAGEGLALDSNRFETNAFWHPVAGTLYYLAARGSDLGVPESLAISFVASAAWEYVAEFREKVSINDLIMTPTAGMAVGEPLHQLSVFFAGGRGPVAGALAVVTSPFRALSDLIDDSGAQRTRRLDRLGLPADTWHGFELFAGAAALSPWGRERPAEVQLGVSAELLDIAEYERAAAAARVTPPGTATRIALQASLAGGDLVRFDLDTRASLGGFFWQDLRQAQGGLSGYNLAVGAATGFEYATQDWQGGWVDRRGVASVLGLTADLGLYHRGLRVRAGLGAFADFSAVSSAAIAEYMRLHGWDGLRGVLANRQYYFALGTTLRPGASVRYRGVEVGGEAEWQVFDSIDGLDRFQRNVTRDIHLHDHRALRRAWLSYTVPGDRLKLTWLSVEHRDRSGRAGRVRAAREETRLLGGVSLLF